MGKASRRKQLDEQRQQFFAIHGDDRSAEDRANARAMLDALQKKLEDDALREDGFYFVDGKYVDSRRPRLTSGMKTRAFKTHRSRITDVAIVRITESPQREKELMILFTIGLDCDLDVSSSHALFVCGAAAKSKTSDLDAVVFSYATCHQQAISSMVFSHDGGLLATASWDSTCMLWNVLLSTETDRPQLPPSPLKSGAKTNEAVRLTLLMMLPVHAEGASCLAFTVDDQALVTCGDCVVKLWDISGASTDNQDKGNLSSSLTNELQEWQQAIPFSLSIESSTNLFAFDEFMPALVPNHEWMNLRENTGNPTLLAPSQTEDEWNEALDIRQCIDHIIEKIDPIEDEAHILLNSLADSKKAAHEVTTGGNNSPSRGSNSTSDTKALTPEESARLRTQFRKMENFDFERLFTPALSLSLDSGGGIDRIPAKTVMRLLSRPDANGRLIRSFSRITADGMFSSHSAAITACAVAQELDIVVTVALDKSIRYWSLEHGVVLESVFDAHSAPITCCALTSPTTCDLNLYEMLLATGGSDNLVKVWRRNPPARVECVYSLSGHNDAIKSLAFDPSGIFLVSSSEDTTAIMWRVRPSSPDPPDRPVVVSVERFLINISWIEPLANGAKILYYVVRTTQVSSFTGDGSDIVAIPDAEVPAKYLSKTIDKLQPGAKYTLRVAAVNQIGASAFSPATEPVETLAFIPSRIDRPVQHENREATCITLSWTAPCPNGAAILSYSIQCRPENSAFVPVREVVLPVGDIKVSAVEPLNMSANTRRSAAASKTIKAEDPSVAASPGTKRRTKAGNRAQSTRAVATLSYTVNELWAGEVYQFVVAASNRCGLGEFSRVSDYVKMDCMAPDQPENPEIMDVDKRQIDVQWVKPRCNGSEILQYTLRWCQQVEDCPSTTEQTVDLLTRSIAGTRYTVTGLEPGSPLQVWVSASNLVDNKLLTSLESLPSHSVSTLCDVPGTPEAPNLVEPTAHTLLLTWMPPKRNGLPIDAYDIVLYSEDTQFGVRVRQLSREFTLKPQDIYQPSSDARTVAFRLSHLRGETFYSAAVSACNSLGSSGVSVACVPVQTSAPTVPDAIPEVPTISDVTPTSVMVTWKLPSHDGGAALRGFHVEYSVRSNRSDPRQEKMESGGGITVSRGLELQATFLKPHRVYRFRVSPENRVGRASPSAWSEEFATPSLVEFTVTRYFAYRPPEEHVAARYIQLRYRSWKKAAADEARFIAALVEVLRHWHI
ncbi:hypothetical protein ON010_g1285 [Phytophthora cinnamomi]|nr:hypothetical protein ON010_g1285 [Phytophthora cinnamomi]